jgi:uncharacterized protein YbjT (DUF2867 family)
MSMARIFVTGATGNVGGGLLRELSAAGTVCIAGLRSDTDARQMPAQCETRNFDFADESLLQPALDGADGLFLMVPFCESMVEWGRRVVEAARSMRVRFIVRLSGLGAAADCPSAMGRLHGLIDEAVRESGIDHCILRCNSFMQNFSGLYRGMIRERGLIQLPEGDAKACFLDTADIASVAAAVLLAPALHRNRTYDLSGPEALANDEAARMLAEVTGRPIRYQPITPEQARKGYAKLGVSPWRIEVLDSLSRFIREGGAASPSLAVHRILGREPGSFRAFALRNRGVWQSDVGSRC